MHNTQSSVRMYYLQLLKMCVTNVYVYMTIVGQISVDVCDVHMQQENLTFRNICEGKCREMCGDRMKQHVMLS